MDPETLETSDNLSEEVTETNYPGAPEQDATDEGTTGGAPAKPDWRVEKYGADWEKSVDYWKDTAGYWRGETDKQKKRFQQSVKGIEDHDTGEPQPRAAAQTGAAKTTGQETDLENLATVKDLVEYMRKEQEKQLDSTLSEREVKARFRDSMVRARSEYNGDPDNGIPGFSELEQEVLIPLAKKQPQVIPLLRAMEDPGKAAYTLAMMLKFQNGFFDIIRGQGREELATKINQQSKEAARMRSNKTVGKSGKLSAADIWNMKPEDFEREVAKTEGRL